MRPHSHAELALMVLYGAWCFASADPLQKGDQYHNRNRSSLLGGVTKFVTFRIKHSEFTIPYFHNSATAQRTQRQKVCSPRPLSEINIIWTNVANFTSPGPRRGSTLTRVMSSATDVGPMLLVGGEAADPSLAPNVVLTTLLSLGATGLCREPDANRRRLLHMAL